MTIEDMLKIGSGRVPRGEKTEIPLKSFVPSSRWTQIDPMAQNVGLGFLLEMVRTCGSRSRSINTQELLLSLRICP